MKKVLQLFWKSEESLQSSSKNTPWAPRTPKRGALFLFYSSKCNNSKALLTIFLVVLVFFSSFIVSCSSNNEVKNPISEIDLKELPKLNWEHLSVDEIPQFYNWAIPYIEQCYSLGVLSKNETEYPAKSISKGRFLILLCDALNCPKTSNKEMSFLDVKTKTALSSSIVFAIENGIIDKPKNNEELFSPDKPIMRWEAALWLAKTKEINYSYYQENNVYILAQDALTDFPSQEAKISFGFCCLPENQLIQYRWSTKNEYRLCKPYSEMNFCDAAYSIYHVLFPPSYTELLSIAKYGKVSDSEIIDSNDFKLLKDYIFTPAVGGRDINWGYYPVMVDKIPNLSDGTLRFLDDGRVQCYFKIRDHLQWADGKTVGSEDVLNGFKFAEQYLDAQVPFEWLLGVKSIDANFVVVTWSRGFYGVERAFWLYPNDVPDNMLWDQYYHSALYKIEIIEDQKVQLIMNDLYFNGSGITNQIDIHFYDEQLDNTDFDVILSDSFEELSQKKENKKEIVFPSMQWEHLDFKMPNTILFEKKVRKALCDAISLEELNSNVWNGDAYPTDRWFLYAHPSNKNVKSDIKDSVVPPEILLEEIEINLIVLASDIYRKNCASYIKEKWESIGIKVNVKELEDEEFFELLKQKSPEEARVFLYSWIFGEKTDLFSILHSTSIPGAKNDYFGENYACYQNGEVDILLLQTLKEVNSQKRAQLLSSIQEIVKNDYYTIPLYNIPQKALIKKDIEGISVPFSGTKLDWNVENWYRYHGGK